MDSVKGMLTAYFPDAKITDIDGVRAELADKTWILVRPSGTEPIIRVTVESLTESRSHSLASQVADAVQRLVGHAS
jgi:phosphoglucosamine mutase